MTATRSSGPDVIQARFSPDALGVWTPTATFFVDPDLCRRYAAATNENDPEKWTTGVAPPLLCVAATVPHVHTVLSANLPERAQVENRSVHGEHDVRYLEPVVPGSTLLVRGRLFGVRPRSTGTAIVTQVEMADPDTGRIVHEEYFINFLRAVMTDDALGDEPSPHRLGDPAALGDRFAAATYHIDDDQTYRYADASGDHSIYHLDNDAARAAGFDSIIVHGLCTMAFASRAVVEHACGGDATALRRLAVRFSRPMYPGHAMTTTLWGPRPADGAETAYRFVVNDYAGATVITDGLAEVGPVATEGAAP